MDFNLLTDELMRFYTQNEYLSEIEKAKAYFFERAGVVDDEAQDYEMKMTQFSDWYVFARPLDEYGVPPVKHALVDGKFEINEALKPAYESLSQHRHSIFEFLKIKKDDLYIKDTLSNYKFVVKKSPVLLGFSKEELFEARLIPHEDSFTFTRGFCFHPPQSKKYILKEIKTLKKIKDEELVKAREDLMTKIYIMRYKQQQYRHLKVEDIYSNTSRI